MTRRPRPGRRGLLTFIFPKRDQKLPPANAANAMWDVIGRAGQAKLL